AGAADDAAEVVGVDPYLEDLTATQVLAPDDDVVLVVDDSGDQVLERLVEHLRPRWWTRPPPERPPRLGPPRSGPGPWRPARRPPAPWQPPCRPSSSR